MINKYIVLSKQFPNKLLHEPIVQTFKNFQNKPGLTCFKVKNSGDGDEHLYLTMWSGSLNLCEQTVADCVSHMDFENDQTVKSIAVLICHGGRFAGSIFHCETKTEKQLNSQKKHVIAESKIHKTFHKYTTRKKQGKRQMNHDKNGGGKSTAGSQIRRNNEKLFQEELETVLGTEWKQHLEQCSCIFVHAPGVHNYTQVTDLLPENIPVSTLPFIGLRPTYQQVLITFKRLMTVHVFNESEFDKIKQVLDEEDFVASSQDKQSAEEEETEDVQEKHRVDYEYYKMISNISNTPTPKSTISVESRSSLFDPQSPIGAVLSPILTSPKLAPLFDYFYIPPAQIATAQAIDKILAANSPRHKSEKTISLSKHMIAIAVPAVVFGLSYLWYRSWATQT